MTQFYIEPGPDTPPQVRLHLERLAASQVLPLPEAPPPFASVFRFWRDVLKGSPPPREDIRFTRETELRFQSMVNQGVPIEEARQLSRSIPVRVLNDRGYRMLPYTRRRASK